ncbi:MAG: bestrophin family ion channel [Pseudomonadota bacterium]
MYVRDGIAPAHAIRDSWRFLLLVTVWAGVVVIIHNELGYRAFAVPLTPVTTIGIVVSLYLGFKTNSAYQRWWEARQIWGGVVQAARRWGTTVMTHIDDSPDETAGGKAKDDALRRRLIHRQIAWVNLLAHTLRLNSRLGAARRPHLFSRRLADNSHIHTSTRASFEEILGPEESAEVKASPSPLVMLIAKQVGELKALKAKGRIDDNRFVDMSQIMGELTLQLGSCERIKNSPFPRQITVFGRIFTYAFIALIPLALVQVFEDTITRQNHDPVVIHEYVILMIPFSVLISWVFFTIERVSESCEDPFEGATTDVPVAALARIVEIDLRTIAGERDIPPMIKPVEGVLY